MPETSFPDNLPCPLGGEDMRLRFWFPRVWTQSGHDGARPFALYWSKAAGFGQLHPSPTAEELQRFYDTPEYNIYMTTHPAAPARRVSRLLDRLRSHLAWRTDRGLPVDAGRLDAHLGEGPARVCDLGCGAGNLLRSLRELGHDVLGVEPNPVAVASCRVQGLDVRVGTAEELPEDRPAQLYDLVTMIQSLEHCRDPLLAIRNAASLIKPRGTLLCEVPNHACIGFELAGPAWFHTDAGRHLSFFTPRSLERALELAGLRPETLELDGYCRQFGWLEAEQKVWDELYGDGVLGPVAPLPRPRSSQYWLLLVRTILASRHRKYDSFRIYARKP